MELPDRDDRDDEAYALLLLLLRRYQDELQQLLGRPPDVRQVPSEFWTRVERDTGDELSMILLATFLASAAHHGAESVEHSTAAALAGVGWAAGQAQRVALGFTQTSRRLLERLGAEWLDRFLTGEPVSATEIRDQTEDIFGETRAIRLASDAVTAGQTAGGEWAVAAMSELSPDDTWHTVADEKVCPVCEPLDSLPRSQWEQSVPSGPPAHPMCRCWIVYSSLPVGAPA